MENYDANFAAEMRSFVHTGVDSRAPVDDATFRSVLRGLSVAEPQTGQKGISTSSVEERRRVGGKNTFYPRDELLEVNERELAGKVRVLRDGRTQRIHRTDLVVGDILLLRTESEVAGFSIPCDVMVYSVPQDGFDLFCDFCALTGEALPTSRPAAPGVFLSAMGCVVQLTNRGGGSSAVVSTPPAAAAAQDEYLRLIVVAVGEKTWIGQVMIPLMVGTDANLDLLRSPLYSRIRALRSPQVLFSIKEFAHVPSSRQLRGVKILLLDESAFIEEHRSVSAVKLHGQRSGAIEARAAEAASSTAVTVGALFRSLKQDQHQQCALKNDLAAAIIATFFNCRAFDQTAAGLGHPFFFLRKDMARFLSETLHDASVPAAVSRLCVPLEKFPLLFAGDDEEDGDDDLDNLLVTFREAEQKARQSEPGLDSFRTNVMRARDRRISRIVTQVRIGPQDIRWYILDVPRLDRSNEIDLDDSDQEMEKKWTDEFHEAHEDCRLLRFTVASRNVPEREQPGEAAAAAAAKEKDGGDDNDDNDGANSSSLTSELFFNDFHELGDDNDTFLPAKKFISRATSVTLAFRHEISPGTKSAIGDLRANGVWPVFCCPSRSTTRVREFAERVGLWRERCSDDEDSDSTAFVDDETSSMRFLKHSEAEDRGVFSVATRQQLCPSDPAVRAEREEELKQSSWSQAAGIRIGVETLEKLISSVAVSGCTPELLFHLVCALQSPRENDSCIVAVTGQSTAHPPALRRAAVSFSHSGATDVAKMSCSFVVKRTFGEASMLAGIAATLALARQFSDSNSCCILA